MENEKITDEYGMAANPASFAQRAAPGGAVGGPDETALLEPERLPGIGAETNPFPTAGALRVPKVFIVGAGPGDPELITLKGARLLERADLVVYAGSLVNDEILGRCKQGCRVLDSAVMTLEEQIGEMTRAADAGKLVVRLHTGDPSLYGAIGEQLARLRANSVSCEIVPGVSSLQGAASRLGIEYTVPGGTQTLICTRVWGRTPVPEAESIEKLAAHGATLALFLSSARVEEVVAGCLRAGRSPETPAAWIYRATWPDEQSAVTTLGGLAESMKSSGIEKHALIVIGDCLNPDGFSRSLLYHPDFSHGRRG